ncbi:MAG TPA: hypothetical protein VK932_05555 [Kofleriaceae bacterium]|nr:hypothetical protein [Kofleriaceae bacterium]
MRNVRGVLFLDYVRMLRAQKAVDWAQHLPPEDVACLSTRIEPDAWYPMATFERFGNEILQRVARGEMFPVQLWGRYSAAQLRAANPTLLEPGDPIETLNRFRVLRATFFDFTALEVPMLHDDEALIVVRYHMGMPAEEAAAHQTMGFFEGLLELAGARDVRARFTERSWAGDPRTLLELRWAMPAPPPRT